MPFFEEIGTALARLPAELYVTVISAIPIIELRGAIPVGAALGLSWHANLAFSLIGNMLPVPLILLFITKIFDLMEKVKLFRPMIEWLRKKGNRNGGRVLGKESEKYRELSTTGRKMSVGVFIGLLTFVALPLPGTGAWSGALVAALFALPRKQSFLAIFLGVLICGIIMTLASYGVLEFLKVLL